MLRLKINKIIFKFFFLFDLQNTVLSQKDRTRFNIFAFVAYRRLSLSLACKTEQSGSQKLNCGGKFNNLK